MDRDAGRLELGAALGRHRARVAAHDRRATGPQRERDRDAGAREPDDEVGTGWERRPREHAGIVWLSVEVGRPGGHRGRLGACAAGGLGVGLLGRLGPQARLRIGAAARELEALGLEAAAHLRRVAERGPSHGAVALEHAVRPRRRRADEALVERAGVLVGAAGGVRDVAVAHPAAGRDGGDDLVEAVGIHGVLLRSVSRPPTLRRGTPNVALCGCFVTKPVLGWSDRGGGGALWSVTAGRANVNGGW